MMRLSPARLGAFLSRRIEFVPSPKYSFYSIYEASRFARNHGTSKADKNAKDITVTFRSSDGVDKVVTGKAGTNLVELAHANDVDLEGACECSLACSTCHVILEPKVYEKLPEPSEDEDDLLDLAFGLTSTSRLGCQVELSDDLQGAVITLPSATRNFYVDGHKPQPH